MILCAFLVKTRGGPLAYEQAETGIAHVVMENSALEPTPPEDCTLRGNYAPTYFLAASAEVDFLRMVWYSAHDSTSRPVSTGTVSV